MKLFSKTVQATINYVVILMILSYLGRASFMPLSGRYLALAVYMQLSAFFFIGSLAYGIYATIKYRRLDSVLLLINSLLLALMLGTTFTYQAYQYLTDAMKERNTSEETKQHITTIASYDELQDLLKTSKHPVIVKCSAAWCPPCRKVTPFYHQLSNELNHKITFAEIDYDSFKGKENLKVVGLPTFIGYEHGKEKGRFTGARALDDLRKEIVDLL